MKFGRLWFVTALTGATLAMFGCTSNEMHWDCDPQSYIPSCHTLVSGEQFAITCADGELVQTQCVSGTVCIAGDCLNDYNVDSCDEANFPATCAGNSVVTCVGGTKKFSPCDGTQSCANGQCVDSGKEPCGENFTNSCDANREVRCVDGFKQYQPCGGEHECIIDTCQPKTDECVDASFEKYCNARNEVVSCEGGQKHTEACDDGQYCAEGVCKPSVTDESCTEATHAPVCKDGALCICVDEKVNCTPCPSGEMCSVNQCQEMTKPDPKVEVVECGKLSISGTGTCESTGSGATTVLRGDILTVDKIYRGGSVVISGKNITYVGCEPTGLDSATVVTCPNSVVSAAMINAHDHITYANSKPGVWGEERFDHRHDWRRGIYGHKQISAPSTQNNEVGELRMLMSGVGSIFGSGSVGGLTRNVDKQTVGNIPSSRMPIYQTFPLGDSGSNSYPDSGCSFNYHASTNNFNNSCAYGPHVAEGINAAAYNELYCLSGRASGGKNLMQSKAAFIHGIAATVVMMANMEQNDTKLIWSPRSNISLYGDTAQVTTYDNMGVVIAVGTDWTYSGSMNMLRELQCIDSLNKNYYGSHFSDYKIWRMATYNGAVALDLDSQLGDLKSGLLADIAVFKQTDTRTDYRAVIDAEPQDVLLVMIDGQVLYGDANVVSATNCDSTDVCGTPKKVCTSSAGKSFSAIKGVAAYPLFVCGVPENEPSCIPNRSRAQDTTAQNTTLYTGVSDANDTDGDGIANNVDNCPTVFNPIRPQYAERVQQDLDKDGFGDACDLYPTCALNNDTCPEFNSDDIDADTIPNDSDNCPERANADQVDSDSDGKGDACDPCPTIPNPGTDRCPVTTLTPIKAIQDKCLSPSGCDSATEVKLTGRVTGVSRDKGGTLGMFIQDPTATNPARSGIYVELKGHSFVANDDVEVQGFPEVVYGMRRIVKAQGKKTGTGAAIVPTIVNVAEVTTGGTKAADLQAVLVKGEGLEVVEAADQYNMWKVKDGNGAEIFVDDFIWITDPKAVAGTHYASITGVLVYDFTNSKIAPRGIEDLLTGSAPLALASLSPETATAWDSSVELTATMNREADEDTTLAALCNGVACAGAPVVVLSGQSSVKFNVAVAQADVNVVVKYNDVEKTAKISAINPALPAEVLAVSPATLSLLKGAKANVTVSLTKAVTADDALTITNTDATGAIVVAPATIVVTSGSSEVTFEVTAAAEAVKDATATLSIKLGAGSVSKDVVVTIVEQAADLPTWDFSTSSLIPTSGVGTLTVVGLTQAFTTGSNVDISITDVPEIKDDNKYIEFKFSTAGLSNIKFEYRTRSSKTGTKKLDFVIGSTVVKAEVLVADGTWKEPPAVDLGAEANNKAELVLKLIPYDASALGGTFRLDDIKITGTK